MTDSLGYMRSLLRTKIREERKNKEREERKKERRGEKRKGEKPLMQSSCDALAGLELLTM